MELSILTNSFNRYGKTPIFKVLEALFELRDPGFGDAITEIEFTLILASKGSFEDQKVHRSLRSNFDNFHSGIDRLEQAKFQRKKNLAVIKAQASFAFAEDIFPNTKEQYAIRNQTYYKDWNEDALVLLLEQLQKFKSKIKNSDDFQNERFLAWVADLKLEIPKSKSDADQLVADFEALKKARYEQLSEWEKLGIDWDQYHSNAQIIVSDPKLWSTVNDLSPNGNDTGADVLFMVLDNKQKFLKASDEFRDLFPQLWKSWGFEWPYGSNKLNSRISTQYRKYTIGYAFALLKVLGECPDWLKERAIEQIEIYQNYIEYRDYGWEHIEEFRALNKSMLMTLKR